MICVIELVIGAQDRKIFSGALKLVLSFHVTARWNSSKNWPDSTQDSWSTPLVEWQLGKVCLGSHQQQFHAHHCAPAGPCDLDGKEALDFTF